MGAGQIGGIATLLDIDFENAAGFRGSPVEHYEANYLVYFLSHAMLFCVGTLIEAHVVLTTATCVHGEEYEFEVYAGTHHFAKDYGSPRKVKHICMHKGFNSTSSSECCATDNLALLVLHSQYPFHLREPNTQFIVNRLQYGMVSKKTTDRPVKCHFYGWGSRRTGYLVPLLIQLKKVEINMLPNKKCVQIFNWSNKYLCLEQPGCRSEKHGALCPDDAGTALVCDGMMHGMMTSRLIDRPCGVGFLDMSHYTKFLACGVSDSRDIMDDQIHEDMTDQQPQPSQDNTGIH